LTDAQVAFVAHVIYSSEKNLFAYVSKHHLEKDLDQSGLRKGLLEIANDYLKVNHEKLINFIQLIFDSCLVIFKKDISSPVKEKALKPIKSILKQFDKSILD
jgi:hypothetical protein